MSTRCVGNTLTTSYYFSPVLTFKLVIHNLLTNHWTACRTIQNCWNKFLLSRKGWQVKLPTQACLLYNVTKQACLALANTCKITRASSNVTETTSSQTKFSSQRQVQSSLEFYSSMESETFTSNNCTTNSQGIL